MRKTLIVFALALTPAIAAAQSVTLAGGVRTNSLAPMTGPQLGAEARARIDAHIAAAEGRGMPTEPMRRLVAEGEARYASESRIIAALGRAEDNMRDVKRAFAKAGREATRSEVAAGAEAIAQGATEAHISALVASAAAERSLDVALSTLTSLASRGEGVAEGVAAIEARLAAGASDADVAAVAGPGSRR